MFRAVLSRGPRQLIQSRLWRALAAVGTFSYSLYLIHEPLLHVLQPIALKFVPSVVALPLTTPIATLFYRLFEEPAIRWSRRFI